MSKRTATADLNQDNWREEQDPEDSGVFQKATPTELKMRAIKRGRRRGLANDGESSSIFKNFKAFSPPTTETTTPTFSFLSDSNDKPKLTNTNPFPSFSFGNKSVTKSPDVSKTEDSSLNNQSKSLSNNLKFNFNVGQDKSSDKPRASLLSSLNSTKTKDFRKVSSPEYTKVGADSVNSDASKTLNPVTSTFKFGLNSKENDPIKGEKTFKFGAHAKESKLSKSPPTSTFKFGINSKQNESKKDPEKSSFKFGINSKEKESGTATSDSTFKFGINCEETEPPSKPLTASSLQFGPQSTMKLNASPSTMSESSKRGGSKNSNVNGLECNTSHVSSKGNTINKFLAKLKTLNFGLLKWVNQHLDKNPYINLKPIFDDYEKHFQEIKSKNGSSSNLEGVAEAPPFSEEVKLGSDKPTLSMLSSNLIGKSNASTPSTSTTLFTFNSSTSKSSKTEPFLFGSQSSSSSSASTVGSALLKDSSKNADPTEVKPFAFGVNKCTSPALSTAPHKTNSSESLSKASNPIFSFGMTDKPISSSFSFGSNDNKPAFSFGSPVNCTNKTSGFSFGSTNENKVVGLSLPNNPPATFSFKPNNDSDSKTSSTTTEEKKGPVEEADDAASDEVPKVEVTEVKENDAIYEKKVKLFYKKDGQYVEKGVGTLFLKPAGEKTQLVVRALTNLGIILLNIVLNESIPTQRVGKNNVLIVCVPNPPLEPKASSSTPVSMLIRVKTGSDADELLEKINEHKK